jgi:hypothetical protein
MTDKTPDPFDSADYYTPYGDAESFTAETVGDAIREHLSEGGTITAGVTLYAYKHIEVEPGWPEVEAERISEMLSEDYDNEYGGDDELIIDADRLTEFRAIASILIKYIVHCHPPQQCEPVGKRIYSPEEVAEILEGKS